MVGSGYLLETMLIRQFIDEGMDAIVFPAIRETSSLFMVQKAHNAGIVVVCFNTCVSVLLDF